MKETIAILTGGGPAPGMNMVVGSVAKTFLHKGYRVVGLHEGYASLFTKNPRIVEIDYFLADDIFNRGGSYIQMSRFKPTEDNFRDDFNLELFTSNNIKLLVTIGGDDTASTANRIAHFLEEKKYPIANIHVPKTIDNDLPLPDATPTFGYHSAKAQGTITGSIIYEDARTSENWFVVAAMGRSAGHLAFGIGAACHYPMIVIPEMFNKTEITIDKICKLLVSSIVKRKLMGVNYGAAMISEGVFHSLGDAEVKNSGINFIRNSKWMLQSKTPVSRGALCICGSTQGNLIRVNSTSREIFEMASKVSGKCLDLWCMCMYDVMCACV
jgi:6-phosphofructokinase 1